MSDEKVYIGTGKILAGKNGYDDRLETAISPEDLEKLLGWCNTTGRWARITWQKRKEPSKNGATHYGVQNTWVPQAAAQPAAPVANDTAALPGAKDDPLPF
jgi:hypothetical protein